MRGSRACHRLTRDEDVYIINSQHACAEALQQSVVCHLLILEPALFLNKLHQLETRNQALLVKCESEAILRWL